MRTVPSSPGTVVFAVGTVFAVGGGRTIADVVEVALTLTVALTVAEASGGTTDAVGGTLAVIGGCALVVTGGNDAEDGAGTLKVVAFADPLVAGAGSFKRT